VSNTKRIRIVADVPFYYLGGPPGEGLSDADTAALASFLLSPAGGMRYSYADLGYEPNERGGETAMFRLTIEGVEAVPAVFLQRIARALAGCDPKAKLHIAEADDLDDPGDGWQHIVPEAELSGEAVPAPEPDLAAEPVLYRIELPPPGEGEAS
jgi:hypothetical protein